jgi:hypothetical protein
MKVAITRMETRTAAGSGSSIYREGRATGRVLPFRIQSSRKQLKKS